MYLFTPHQPQPPTGVMWTNPSNSFCIVQDNHYGIYDSNTKTFLLPVKYKYIQTTNFPHLFKVAKNTKHGIYDAKTNTWPVPMKYINIFSTPSPNLWIVLKQRWWHFDSQCSYGLYSSYTNTFITPIGAYNDIERTNSPILWIVRKNGKYGIYDSMLQKLDSKIVYDKIDTTNDPYVFEAIQDKVKGILRGKDDQGGRDA